MHMKTLSHEPLEALTQASEAPDDKHRPMLHRPITRRKALGGLLFATAGTATAGFGRPAVASADATQTMTRAGKTIILGPINAPDGFPQASLEGIYAGSRGRYCMVIAANSVVPITVMPTTRVFAGGAAWAGALKPLAVGDRLFVFSRILESGERVASVIEQNPRIYKVVVTSIAGSELGATTVASDRAPGVSLTFVVNALTQFPQGSIPEVGSQLRVATISNAPVNPSQIVAMKMNWL
jgi:hypothetical protein